MEKVKIGEYIGEYFIRYRYSKKLVTHIAIANAIAGYRNEYGFLSQPTTQEQVHHAISKAREYLEINYRLTIWNDRGYGFKVASPDEYAMIDSQNIRKTFTCADRTNRMAPGVDRTRVRHALRLVFADSEKRVQTLSRSGKKYLAAFINLVKEEKAKQIEEKKTHETRTQKKN